MTIRITGDGPKITATGSGSTVLVEISTGQHDPGSFSGVHNDLTGRSTSGAHVGTAVSIDPTGFAGNLDGTIVNAQLLAAAVDDLTTGGGGGGSEVVAVSSAIVFDIDGIYDPSTAVLYTDEFYLAVIAQLVNPSWNGIWQGTSNGVTPAAMVRVADLPGRDGVITCKYLSESSGDLGSPQTGGFVLAHGTEGAGVYGSSGWYLAATGADSGGGAALSDSTPQALGTAAAGTGTAAARDDHVHAMPTATSIAVDASGFNGNLTTSDDTVQEIAQKLDDLVAGGTVASVISSATFPGWAPIGPNHAATSGSVNHGLGGLGREAYAPFFCPAGTYDAIGVLSTVAAVSTWRLGIDDNTAGWPGAVLLDAGTVNMNATAGWQVITGLTFTVTHPRWLWTHVKCVAYTASPTVQCLDGVGSAGSSPRIPGWPTYGSLPHRAYVGAGSSINSGSAGVLTAAGPVGSNSATQVGFAQYTPLILLRRSS